MIINSYIQNIDPQADGRKYITEIQIDDVLGEQQFFYLCDAKDDPEQIMQDRIKELNSIIPPDPTVVLQEQVDALNEIIDNTTQQLDDTTQKLDKVQLSKTINLK